MASRPKTFAKNLPGLKQVLRRLWPYARQQKGAIASSLLALFAGIALRLFEPWPLTIIIDHVIRVGDSGGRVGALDGLRQFDPMWLTAACAGLLVLLTLLRAMTQYANKVGFARIGNRVIAQLRRDVFAHIQRLPLSFHNTARTGDLTLRVIQDVNLMRDAAVTAILPLLASSLVLVSLWCVMFWLQWELALIALATAPLMLLRTRSLTGKIRVAARKQRKRQGALATTAAESIGAIKNVQALSLEDAFEDDFGARNLQSQSEDVKTARLTANLGRSVDVLIAGSTALVLGFGTQRVLRGLLSPGELLVFLTYLRRAFKPVQDFAKYTGRLAKATAAGERVIDLLDRESDVRDLPDAVDAPAFRGELRFEGVDFGYEEGSLVFRGLDFEVAPGQRVALVGPSGIGKTTLIDLLFRFYDPLKGRICVDGRDLRDFRLVSVRSQISVVLQDSMLFAASLRDNIAYGNPDCSDQDLETAARLARAAEFIEALPEGYDTIVGERGSTLSGGQRQRIAIARALVRRAPILILDEPTTGLDEENRIAVLEALDRLAEGSTTLIVSHDLQLCARADTILYLEAGSILESGSHAELMERGGRYADLVRRQASSNRASVDVENGTRGGEQQ